MFADLIPQKALNRVQQNQARQSDIRADLPHQTLGIKQTYIEIKTVSESVRERRVAAIGDEYEDNAKAAEIKLFGGNDGQGPGSRLASVGPILGVAAGRFGELSASGQASVTTIAEDRVKNRIWPISRGRTRTRPTWPMRQAMLDLD